MTINTNNVRVLVRELIDDAGPTAESWVIKFTRPISDEEVEALAEERLGEPAIVDRIQEFIDEVQEHFEADPTHLADSCGHWMLYRLYELRELATK